MNTREGLQTLIDVAARDNRGLALHGRYECDGPIRLPDKAFTLEGDGVDSTILAFAGIRVVTVP